MTAVPPPAGDPARMSRQATVRTFDPASRAGTAVRDDGGLVDLPAAAFAAGGLLALRPGQRVRLEEHAGVVTLVTIATLPSPQ